MTLRDQGFRFVKRGDEFRWVHRFDVHTADIDCTDMDDEQFERFVLTAQ